MFRITYRLDESGAGRYSISPDSDQARCVVASIACWRPVAQLAAFAQARHGYGDTDGGFGVTYPADQDEDERDAKGEAIPPGSVRVYGYWGAPDGYEFEVSEAFYLNVLIAVLEAHCLSMEAKSVKALRDSLLRD